MAISQVNGTTSASTSSGSSSLAINKPTDVAVGDVLTACITCDGTAPTAPSGWVEFGGGLHPSASWNNRLYYKIVDGTEGASFTWTTGTVGPSAGCINAWRGVDLADPIAGISEATGTTSTEPNTGPDLVIASTEPIGRLFYVRAVRESDEAAEDPAYVAADLTEAVAGISRRQSIGNVSASGNTAYTIAHFSNDSNYSGAATYGGLAVSSDRTEDHNYEATYALRADNTGTADATVPALTSDFVGDHSNNSTLEVELPLVAAEFEGSSAPPEGSIDASVPLVSSSLAGGIPVDGVLDSTLPMLDVFLFSETRPFGHHVIVVEPEKRGLLVVDQNNSADLIPIYLSEVTVGTIPAINPDAELAEATATAYDATTTSTGEAIQASAELVTVPVVVYDATAAIVGSTDADAEAVSVAAASYDATVATSINGEGSAELVSAAVAANDATVSISISDNGEAELVSSAVTANDATVSTVSSENAPAEEVVAAATVNDATVTAVSNITASAELVTASVTANNATVTAVSNITASAELVTVSTTVNNATVTAVPQASASAGLVTVAVAG